MDLFCGAGGFSLGFREAGFRLLNEIDTNEDCIATYKQNLGGHAHCGKVSLDVLTGLKPDVLVGGPPCQPFSLLGAKHDFDPREGLTRDYMEVVRHLKPKVFVIENVPGYFRSVQSGYVARAATRLGYCVTAAIIDAAKHGVAQRRKRAFIIGSRLGTPFFPQDSHPGAATVKEAIGDLTGAPTGQNWHVGRSPRPLSLRRYQAVPPGGNRFSLPRALQPPCWKDRDSGSVDVFGRLWWERPSVTIRTEFVKPEKGRYLHPDEDRPITPREGARLQSFPDSFIFTGSMTSVVRQIGNAVPPRLAYRLALAVKCHLDGTNGAVCDDVLLAGFPTTTPIVVEPTAARDRRLIAEYLGAQ